MGLVGLAVLFFLQVVSLVFDVVTYIPYYFIQEPTRALAISHRRKAVNLSNSVSGPYRCEEDSELTTTPNDEQATLDDMFQSAVNKFRTNRCIGYLGSNGHSDNSTNTSDQSEQTSYTWLTYGQVNEQVSVIGRGLRDLGLAARQPIVIYAETRPEWMIAAQACFRFGFYVISLSPAFSLDAAMAVINEARPTFMLTTTSLLNQMQLRLGRLEHLTHIIYLPSEATIDVCKLFNSLKCTAKSWEEILEIGMTCTDAGTSQETIISCTPHCDDLALVMYTSGTTGAPTGVQITHANLLATCSGILSRLAITSADVYAAYLPLSHIMELTAELSCLSSGCSMGYSKPAELMPTISNIGQVVEGHIHAIQPTILATVPTILEKFHKSVLTRLQSAHTLTRLLFVFAVQYKKKWMMRGSNTPLMNSLFVDYIRYQMGGKVRLILCGGASLNSKTQDFLRLTLSCPIIQGYGTTETCAAGCLSDLDDLRSGRVGAPMSCCQILLRDWEDGGYLTTDSPPRGEVLIGGPTVSRGYFRDPAKTEEEFEMIGKMRWFCTGDIAELKNDGSLKIIDRRKDLIKVSNGEFIPLGRVEAVLRMHPVVDNVCVVVRPGNSLIVALISPNKTALQEFAQDLGKVGSSSVELCQDKEIIFHLMKELNQDSTKAGVSVLHLPSRITLVTEQWVPELGLLTPSLKLRRQKIAGFYREEIEELFSRSRRHGSSRAASSDYILLNA